MHAFQVLGDGVRRRIVELLGERERSSGELAGEIQDEFGISQPAVSQHLRVLREAGFASARADGNRRIYQLEPDPLREIDDWLEPFRAMWAQRLDALATEIERGKRERRLAAARTDDDDNA